MLEADGEGRAPGRAGSPGASWAAHPPRGSSQKQPLPILCLPRGLRGLFCPWPPPPGLPSEPPLLLLALLPASHGVSPEAPVSSAPGLGLRPPASSSARLSAPPTVAPDRVRDLLPCRASSSARALSSSAPGGSLPPFCPLPGGPPGPLTSVDLSAESLLPREPLLAPSMSWGPTGLRLPAPEPLPSPTLGPCLPPASPGPVAPARPREPSRPSWVPPKVTSSTPEPGGWLPAPARSPSKPWSPRPVARARLTPGPSADASADLPLCPGLRPPSRASPVPVPDAAATPPPPSRESPAP